MRWIDNLTAYFSKRLGERYLANYAKNLARFRSEGRPESYDPRFTAFMEILEEMEAFEWDKRMKQNWRNLRTIFAIVMGQDGAYRGRILMVCYKIFERYDRLVLNAFEIRNIDRHLKAQGLPGVLEGYKHGG